MEVIAIREPKTTFDYSLIDQMHQLRARVFRDRLGWKVTCRADREYDEYDLFDPTYLVIVSEGRVVGSVRLLPADGPTMIEGVFPQLLGGLELPKHQKMIESSRFCVDTAHAGERSTARAHQATLSLFAGIIEWCLANDYNEIATATDVRFERLLSRCGWPLRRLGKPVIINETRSVAGLLSADALYFERLRPRDCQLSIVGKACLSLSQPFAVEGSRV
ncbi:GNAT family N-acetyltransferase [Rhizobium cauense]|uniref:acyl-homoserine-lactone synthase n=1 Tax=Rhizobium cauense TaxID=1166683 RepID=UPI001C6F505F|nr:acyl-homoserine-lactone synthase [Rhizobium cauense]MBW9118372.1 GNAT family N-acetyltransferase [Rhizobium cauense]